MGRPPRRIGRHLTVVIVSHRLGRHCFGETNMSARAALILGILVVVAGCSEPTAAERAAEQARWDAEAARQPEQIGSYCLGRLELD